LGFGFGFGLGVVVRFARVFVDGAGRDTAGWDAAGATGVAATGAVRAGAGAVRVAVSAERGGSGLGVALVFDWAGASVRLDVVVDVFAAGAFTLRVDWVGGGASGSGSGAPPAPSAAPVDVSAVSTRHADRAALVCRCRRDDVLGAIRLSLPPARYAALLVRSMHVADRVVAGVPATTRPHGHLRMCFFFIPPWSASVIAPAR
jgi:hypothetical protein